MKILVTGGTGFIGRHLIPTLLEKGHDVTCLVRRTSNTTLKRLCCTPLYRLYNTEGLIGAKFAFGELEDLGSLVNAATGVDAIIHLAGKLESWGVSKKDLHLVNVVGTRDIVAAAKKVGVKKFIHCSTCGVFGTTETPANENFPYAPTNFYEKTKVEAEKIVEESRLHFTIVRPEFVYGPGDYRLLPLFKSIKKGRFFLINRGKSYLHPTYVDDVENGLVLALENGAEGESYNIAGDRCATVKEFADIIAIELSAQAKFGSLSKSLAFAAACMSEGAARIFNFNPPLKRFTVRFMSNNRWIDCSKARNELGYKPTVTLEEGIKKTAQFYKDMI